MRTEIYFVCLFDKDIQQKERKLIKVKHLYIMSKSIFYSSMKSILRPHIKPICHEFNSDDNVILKKSNRIIIEIASECVIERPCSFSLFQLNINNLVHFISDL